MKKVVITGATGIIGVFLSNYLLNKNIEVLAIVRENSFRLKNLPKNDKLKIVQCNLDKLKYLELDSNDYDIFFHLGWEGTSPKMRNDENVQKMNIEYTLDSVKLAKKIGCKKFIGAGSQAEYGITSGVINENTVQNPIGEYGKAKLKAGIESRALAEKIGIEHNWARIFSIYGPYDNDNTMIMQSIREMINGISPEYTDGEQNWDYLYSEDVAKALYLIAEKGKNMEVYCVGYGKTDKLKNYIEIIKNIINPEIQLKLGFLPHREKESINLSVDISKLKEDTGFKPDIEFSEGIKRTIEWYTRKGNILNYEKD